jgi:hypothetical protein
MVMRSNMLDGSFVDIRMDRADADAADAAERSMLDAMNRYRNRCDIEGRKGRYYNIPLSRQKMLSPAKSALPKPHPAIFTTPSRRIS